MKLAPGLELPIEAVTETIAILGRRGSGKTYTGAKLAEEMLSAGQQVIIIDPLDVWWGLRSDAKGTEEAHSIAIFGGRHGDINLGEKQAEQLADAILETGTSAILSLRHLSKAASRRFVGVFCDRLYHRKGEDEFREPLHLIIDEADAFVPQKPQADGLRAHGAIDTIVRRGRSSGFGTTLITQRAAVISKDVLTQTEVLVCHQTNGPQDRKALEAWVEQNDDQGRKKEFLASLAKLEKGQAWFWSPAWLELFKLVKVGKRQTFDSSSTPKAGARAVSPKTLAKVDLKALEALLVTEPEESTPSPSKTSKTQRKELATALAQRDDLAREVEKLRKVIASIRTALDVDHVEAENRRPTAHMASSSSTANRGSKRRSHADRKPTGKLAKGEGLVLQAIVQYEAVGCTRTHLTVLTGYKRSSRDTYIQKLKAAGYIEQDGDRLVATASGRRECPEFEPLPTGQELLEYWLRNLPQGEAAVLQCVSGRLQGATRDEISKATGYKRSSRDTYIQKLRARELVVVAGRNVELADSLVEAS